MSERESRQVIAGSCQYRGQVVVINGQLDCPYNAVCLRAYTCRTNEKCPFHLLFTIRVTYPAGLHDTVE